MQTVLPTNRPRVYLDHCALREISQRQDLADAFAVALDARPATWCISWANLMEFREITSDETIAQAEKLASRCVRQVSFIEIDPFMREDTPILAPQIAHAALHLKTTNFEQLSMKGLFGAARSMTSRMDLGQAFVARIQALRKEYQEDAGFRDRVDRGSRHQEPKTLGSARALLRVILRNRTLRIDSNDAMDFYHAAIPLAYCDFVVLDSRWADMARQCGKIAIRVRDIEELPRHILEWKTDPAL